MTTILFKAPHDKHVKSIPVEFFETDAPEEDLVWSLDNGFAVEVTEDQAEQILTRIKDKRFTESSGDEFVDLLIEEGDEEAVEIMHELDAGDDN